MKVQVNFKIINPEYCKKYAAEYHGGDESDSNSKYLWAVAYEVKDVKSVAVIENEDFVIKGVFKDGQQFQFNIPDVMIYRCYFERGDYHDFAVSKTILNKTHQAKREGYDVTRFYFYINLAPASVQLSDNLIVNEKDIPEELVQNK